MEVMKNPLQFAKFFLLFVFFWWRIPNEVTVFFFVLRVTVLLVVLPVPTGIQKQKHSIIQYNCFKH